MNRINSDLNVLALVKGEERYIWLYHDDQRSDAMLTLDKFASNPDLSFTWFDAAVLSQRIRDEHLESQEGSPRK